MTRLLTYLTAALVFIRLLRHPLPHRCDGDLVAWEMNGHKVELFRWIWNK